MHCPRCSKEQKFTSQSYEGVNIDICSQCHGIWLDEGELPVIVNTKEVQFDSKTIKDALTNTSHHIPESEKISKECCPKCGASMIANNYGYGSGVILDRCPKSHGVWLDQEELVKIQIYSEQNQNQSDAKYQEWTRIALKAEKDYLEQHKKAPCQMPSHFLFYKLFKKISGIK